MARLRDVSQVLKSVGPFAFARRVWRQGSEDQLLTLASALAYSWLFAVFPFFIFLMTLVPYLPAGAKHAAEREMHKLVYLFPKQGADALWEVETHLLNEPPGSVWLRVLGLAFALWSASGGMATTMNAIDRCYELREGRGYFRQRFLAMLLTIVVANLVLVIVLLLPIGWIVKRWIIHQNIPGLERGSWLMVAFDTARWCLAVPGMISILTVLYHFGPYVKHKFHWLTPGAVFSICVWVMLGFGFKFYLDHFANYNKTYGTVGGAAVMLLMFYIDAAVLLFGAEINSEIDFEVLKIQRGQRNFMPAESKAEGTFVGPLTPEEAKTAPPTSS
jgi:membrane protein